VKGEHSHQINVDRVPGHERYPAQRIIMERYDVIALLIVLGITAALVYGLIYFVRELCPFLPPAMALIGFILLAAAVIGSPIYALVRLSNRIAARLKNSKSKATKAPPKK
jgi:xanthosine utilization system XapX-like protein